MICITDVFLENFVKAAAAIKAASLTFRQSGKNSTPTVSRREVDSTPVMVTKFDDPQRELLEAEFISQSGKNSPMPRTSRSLTPLLNGRVSLIDIVPGIGTPEPTTPLSPDSDVFVAKFDYVPTAETELGLTKGQRVTVIEKADNNWWHGLLDDNPAKHGWFPESFVEAYQPEPDQNTMEASRKVSQVTIGSSDEIEATGLFEGYKLIMQLYRNGYTEVCR